MNYIKQVFFSVYVRIIEMYSILLFRVCLRLIGPQIYFELMIRNVENNINLFPNLNRVRQTKSLFAQLHRYLFQINTIIAR